MNNEKRRRLVKSPFPGYDFLSLVGEGGQEACIMNKPTVKETTPTRVLTMSRLSTIELQRDMKFCAGHFTVFLAP